MKFSWIKQSPMNHYKANINICQKTLSCPANVRCINNSMKETTVVEKLSKQLRPPPLPTPLRTMNVWQRLLTVLKICSHFSVVTNPGFWLHMAVWKAGLSLQPHKQIGTAMWLNWGQWRVTATRTFLHPTSWALEAASGVKVTCSGVI